MKAGTRRKDPAPPPPCKEPPRIDVNPIDREAWRAYAVALAGRIVGGHYGVTTRGKYREEFRRWSLDEEINAVVEMAGRLLAAEKSVAERFDSDGGNTDE